MSEQEVEKKCNFEVVWKKNSLMTKTDDEEFSEFPSKHQQQQQQTKKREFSRIFSIFFSIQLEENRVRKFVPTPSSPQYSI